MKHTALFIITLLLSLLVACSGNSETSTGGEPSATVSESTSTIPSETSSETNPGTEESEPTDTVVSEEPTEKPAQSTTITPSKAPDNPTSKPPSTSTPTNPPATSQPPAETPKPPSPSQPPVTSTPTQSAFNINDWIQFTKNYGKSIGLIYDSRVNGCWDTPITASSSSKYLERDIKGYLDSYVRDGMEYFNVWYEQRTDGKYDLYIAYG